MRRFFLRVSQTTTRARQLLGSSYAAALIAALAAGSGVISAQTIALTPGSLASKIDELRAAGPTLKLEGTADVRDLRLLADSMPASVVTLDMAGLSIDEYTYGNHSAYGSGFYAARTLPAYTFAGSRFTSVTLPADLEEIGEGAFANSALQSITTADGLRQIGDYAFFGCTSLGGFRFPAALTSVGKGAFEGCSALTEADMSAGSVRTLADRAFAGCTSLARLQLHGGHLAVGSEVFSGSAIARLDVSYDTQPAPYAFASMPALTKVEMHGSQNSEGEFFDNAALDSIEVPWHTLPPYFAAGNSRLANDNLLLYVDSIDHRALKGIAADSLVLGARLVYVGRAALEGASGLKQIDAARLTDQIPEADADSFEGLEQEKIKLLVVDNFIDLWKEHPAWGRFNVVGIEANGIDDITADTADGISIQLNGSQLEIGSPQGIAEARIYSLAGRLLYFAAPQSALLSVDISPYLGDVVIVSAVATDGREKSVKILLPRR